MDCLRSTVSLRPFLLFLMSSVVSASPFVESPCKIKGTTVNCTEKNLTEVPSVPNDTAELILNFNWIQEVSQTFFPKLQQLTVLYLADQHTKRVSIRKEAFKNVLHLIYLDLSGNMILVLDPDAFVGLTYLSHLSLGYAGLNSSILETDYFHDLVSLETLNLHGNNIDQLKLNPLFSNLSFFHTLNLTQNKLYDICESDMSSLQGKKSFLLDISGNQLYHMKQDNRTKECPNPFWNIFFDRIGLADNKLSTDALQQILSLIRGTIMHHVILCSNRIGKGYGIQSTDPDIQTFTGFANSLVKILDLSNCFIVSLNTGVFNKLSHLEQLFLEGNRIFIIQEDAFSGLYNLKMLDLSRNLFGEIYDYTFRGLDNIMHINLSVNSIGFIQKNTFDSTHLQTLDLNNNAISTLHFELTNVTCFNVSSNKISSKSIYPMPCAAQIDFSRNVFKDLEIFATIMGCSQVQRIWLNENKLSMCFLKRFKISVNNQLLFLDLSKNNLGLIWNAYVCLDMFQNLGKLETLNLSHNSLTFLPQVIFGGLLSLKELCLSFNKLFDFTYAIFPNTLIRLDISYNQLMVPNPDVFSFIPVINLGENPYVCQCSLEDFVIWVKENNISTEHMYCTFPLHLYKSPLDTVLSECVKDDERFVQGIRLSLFVTTLALLTIFNVSVIILVRGRGFCYAWYKAIQKALSYGSTRQHDRGEHKYDAYLCFNRRDMKWVQSALLQHLDSQFSEQNQFLLCFEERDFIPGADHITNIKDAIWNSKKTICIVTRQFLKDGLCIQAFNIAQSRYFYDSVDVIIMLVVGRLPKYKIMKCKPLRTFVEKRQYIRWPEEDQGISYFVDKLGSLLLNNKKMKKKNAGIRLQHIKTIT
ncbi:toll-like receptor 5 [Protopterus annectens]|uniref:toll-like receptor 5 n=1 Tax=Protopterus annectens TaxID=7888 RepID=UPI001CF9DE15|nr:toll-like receptor 5 [Protopterus annectens]XP_043914017.1 toll-like receptor 5 [Protopterus annectens]XP_043914025.1 toll-like receptor 5 [Protopterus annectens]